MNRQNAFTLVELMVTLAVLGISLMVAVPSFISLTQTNRTASETNSLVGALTYARSEASKTGSAVSVCSSNNGTTCVADIGWNSGWIVFINSDGDTPAQVDAGETILRVYGKVTDGSAIDVSPAMADYITYQGNGFSNAQGQFVYCDRSGTASARVINVSRSGRISLTKGGGSCAAL